MKQTHGELTFTGKHKMTNLLSSSLVSVLLTCISDVETGGDCKRIGTHGERSEYQLSKAVVADFNKWTRKMDSFHPVNFRLLSYEKYRTEARVVAEWHLRRCMYIVTTHHRYNPPPAGYVFYKQTYLCWNLGVTKYLLDKKPNKEVEERAERFANLVESKLKH